MMKLAKRSERRFHPQHHLVTRSLWRGWSAEVRSSGSCPDIWYCTNALAPRTQTDQLARSAEGELDAPFLARRLLEERPKR